MTQQPSPVRVVERRPPAGAAGWVVALSLVTSAAAHAEAGGLLPGPSGSALLVLVMGLLWCVASRTTRTRVGLLVNFALGQALCHLAYGMGAGQARTLTVTGGGMTREGHPMTDAPMAGGPMAGHAMSGHQIAGHLATGSAMAGHQSSGHPMTAHTMGPMPGMTAHAMGSMPGMGSAAGMHQCSHPALAMLLAHATAVVVSTALVLVLRRLPAAAHRWLRRLLPTPPRQLVVLSAPRGHSAPLRRVPLWAHAPPPPRRGPPLPA